MTRLTFASLIVAVLLCPPLNAQVTLKHESWNAQEFSKMTETIRLYKTLNLLVFPGAKLVQATGVGASDLLIDGDAGDFGGNGRVTVDGKPSVIRYYLGKPRPIQEIRLYTANGDSRSNQDFEIRLANGKAEFPAEAAFTSGDKILGNNGGGFLTRIVNESGKPLGDGKYDWIEFKLWHTYPSNAGGAAKAANNQSNGWSAYVELQVIGDVNDPALFAGEKERQDWFAAAARADFNRKLTNQFGSDVLRFLNNPNSLKLAIEDLGRKFPAEYDSQKYLVRYEQLLNELNTASTQGETEQEKYLDVVKRFNVFRREALLANPLMKFEKLLFRRAQNAGLTNNWISNAARGKGHYGNALATVNPRDAQGEAKTIIENPNNSFVGDVSLHWDADKMLVTALNSQDRTWQVHELKLDGEGGLKQITVSPGNDVDNVEGCYSPDGATLFISTANMMGVPCIDGSSTVGNIYRLETDGKTVRQLTFEQDQDWCPVCLPNGRILYLRWEYIDTPHYFTRLLFHMNPDGTNQVEYYGSNSFWPNSLFYARNIPGSSTKFAAIVSGHHGVSRMGELVLFDIEKGRQETQGVIQRIPGYGQPVEAKIKDTLVDGSWPKFLFPAPLDENYLIVSASLAPGTPWSLYLVDTFDNMLELRSEPGYGLFEATPVIKRPHPAAQQNRVDAARKDSNVFVTDVYFGNGLKDVPKGTVKKFRVFAFNYGYRGIGSHNYFGMESCWDARRILGEVPVYEDGSASFVIPANTPLAIQPLDANGSAVQLMRTWFVGMPGENQSCNGCHDSQNTASPNRNGAAARKRPSVIEPFLGPERPFSYKYEVQPVLDRYCAGCHKGAEGQELRPNFADTSPGQGGFSKSYHALHRFVRRPGPEGDYHMYPPMEYHTSTSELFQMLEKGHYGVKMDADSMRKLYTWVDLNVPYFGTWIEIAERMNRKNVSGTAKRAAELRNLYAGIDFNPEADAYKDVPLPQNIEFIQPPKVTLNYAAPAVKGFPFDESAAKKMQTRSKQPVNVTDDVAFDLVWIPAGEFVMGDEGGFADELPRSPAVIKKPFWMATTEVTNALYNLFDPEHDSRFIDQWHKDHTLPGYPANNPQQPVIRVNWNKAKEFCVWLSGKTGKKFRLPTEAEWEWAARAGSAAPFWFGGVDSDFGKYENLSDISTKLFVVRGVNPQPIQNPPDIEAFIPRSNFNDGNMIAQGVGGYLPNPWGLYDMHGSVAEWTGSDYRPYPYRDSANDVLLRKTVRGGSWRDRPQWSRSGIRRAYEAWQPVYNVGIRLVCDE
ncbi:MAG: SUMF1/EgtB/PvdO family nonheme iron enzyme [Planctomycetaceae bacterium]|jgi:formylglycine-generating enzyme required for sulfatase activity|nr:SUMF1/EgtB/PvdO family nonheme iron enzyme [Planctomycetaceae bacterium]